MNNLEDLNNLLGNLITDVGECERTVVQDTRINESLYLKHIAKVKLGLLSVNSGTWEGFRKIFDEGLLDALQLISENISAYKGEEFISEENLATLQSDVEDVINRVVDSDLEDVLKNVLFDGLEAVRNAILNYEMFGAEGIRNAVDRNVGSYARYRCDFERAEDSEIREVICAYKKVLNEVNAIISTALKFKQLAEPVAQVLPMLGMG